VCSVHRKVLCFSNPKPCCPICYRALQGLLRKLGAGFDDIMAMSGGLGGSRYKVGHRGLDRLFCRSNCPNLTDLQAILNNLRQVDDESAQLGALTELCEIMAISSEDMLQSFPIETAVPSLVRFCCQPSLNLLQCTPQAVGGVPEWNNSWYPCCCAACRCNA
jgi:hypothetical protein